MTRPFLLRSRAVVCEVIMILMASRVPVVMKMLLSNVCKMHVECVPPRAIELFEFGIVAEVCYCYGRLQLVVNATHSG